MIPKILVWLLATFLLATAPLAEAQQPAKIPRLGYLTQSSLAAVAARTEAFRQGLRDLGYVEGKNIMIEWRGAEGNRERQDAFAAELARLKVDVIVTGGSSSTRSAKEATSTIPIVFTQDPDPVGRGLVASLAHPGGNVTGLCSLSPALGRKRLEILKDVVPGLSLVAVFGTSTSAGQTRDLNEIELAAEALGVKLEFVDVLAARDIEPAFRAAVTGRADAILWQVSGTLASTQRKEIAVLAEKSRLPTIYHLGSYVEAGGLMYYGVNLTDLDRRAPVYVDKILKGTKPSELPVEQPMKFEFIVNLKTAKQIGLTIPPNVLARADRVIK
jgi:putative ABC transport system substrate-binding protein